MHKHEKAIRGGFTAEPYYKWDNITGFIVYWTGIEVASFGLNHAAVIMADNAPKIPGDSEEYILSFFAIVNRENTSREALAAWWTAFDRFIFDPLWH